MKLQKGHDFPISSPQIYKLNAHTRSHTHAHTHTHTHIYIYVYTYKYIYMNVIPVTGPVWPRGWVEV